MIKQRLRELTKSFGSHVDPEKTERLKRTKTEIENNVTRIRKLIKNEDHSKKEGKKKVSKKESELLRLIEDFYKEYQSLYSLYDHLIKESEKFISVGEDSDSDSDSEYYSSDEMETNDNKAEHHKAADSIKEEFEAANSERLASQIKKCELEARLACQIKESSNQAEGLMDQIKSMQQELNSLCQQKTELEEKLNKEISQNLIKIESMKEELTSKVIVERQTLEAKVKELTLQVDSLRNEKEELQKQTTYMNNEIDQLRLEKESLHSRVFELESSLSKAEETDQLFQAHVKELQLQVDSLCNQKEDFVKHTANKSSKIDELNLENDSLNAKLLELEILMSKRDEDLQECAMQVDSLCNKKEELEKEFGLKNCEIVRMVLETESLQAKMLELEGSLSKREEEFSTCHKEHELEMEKASMQIVALTAHVDDLKLEVDSLKTQIDNLELQSKKEKRECPKTPTVTEYRDTNLSSKVADQLRILKEQENKTGKVRLRETKTNLQVVERKVEDFAEKCRISIEDNIRMLSRRILVAEQLQNENKENYRRIKEKYDKEEEQLKHKIATYEKENELLKEKIATYEAELKNRRSLPVYQSIDENVTNEIKQLKQNMDCLVTQLNVKEEEEVILKKEVLKLEAEVNAINQFKEKVGNYENQMKEMDQRLLSLGDEKREAIRQLCILIDYHRSQFEDLKKVDIKNSNVRHIKTNA